MNKSKKNFKYTTLAWILAIMLLVVMIPLNVIADKLDVTIDMTPNKMYTLSDTTIEYINSIDKNVDLYLLMKMDEIENDDEMLAFSNVIKQYSEFENINFMDIDPDTNPEIVSELNPDGYLDLKAGDMVVKCGDMIKRIPASSMYVYEGNEDETSGEFVVDSAYFQGENYITGAIKSVVEGKIPTVYFLTGHGEKSLEDNYTKFKTNLKNYNYGALELNLAVEKKVPDDAAIVIIPAPKKDITEEEKDKLNNFLDEGGNISLLMSPNEEELEYKNIASLMNSYGLAMDYNKVYETDDSKHVSGDKYKIIVDLVQPAEDDTDAIDLTSALMDDTFVPYMPASRSFYEVYNDNYNDLIINPLISTNETAVGEIYGDTAVDPDEQSGILYLAAYSQDTKRNNSKMVVMGNAEFIDDDNLQEDYVIVPVYLYLSTITWMYNSDINMDIPSREKTYDYMTIANAKSANSIMVIFGAAPIVIAAIGICVWLKRRNS